MRDVYARILRNCFAALVTAWVGNEMRQWANKR